MKDRISRGLFAAAALAVSLAVATPAKAATIQLGFILDSSGSIGLANWGIITTGLANAINTHIPVGGLNTYEISVVTFSDSGSTILNHALIDDAGDLAAASAAVAAAPFLGGQTNYADAFADMQAALTSSPLFGSVGASYVNFATDGAPNLGGTGIPERNNLIAAGIDNISIEGINIGAAGALLLQNSYCYPGPCDIVAPFDTFPTNGFYLGVANAQGYVDAIGNKIAVVTETPIPEPTSMLLLGTGLLLAGHRRLRRRT